MFISVIIPAYNRAHTLERALNSVYQSDYKDFEVIVVDDGSTDSTQTLLHRLKAEYPNLRVLSQVNRGVSAARNRGVKSAHGDWVAFLDSDDEWFPQKLARQVEFAQNFPQYRLIHSEEIWIRNDVRVNPKRKHRKWAGEVFRECVEMCFISPSTAMIERDYFIELGGFDESFIVCEDYDLWIKASLRGPIGLVSEPLIQKYGGHEDQLSTKFFAMDLWRLRALTNALAGSEMASWQREFASQQVVKKGTILLTGFYKHNNTEHCQEVSDMVEKAQLYLNISEL